MFDIILIAVLALPFLLLVVVLAFPSRVARLVKRVSPKIYDRLYRSYWL